MNKNWKRLFLIAAFFLLLCGCTGTKKENYDLAGKTFYNTIDEYESAEHAKLRLGKDGSFVLTDNFFDGSYELSGKWTLKENVLTLDVEKSGVGEYTKVMLEVKDDNTLVLKSDLAGSKAENIFSTDKPETGASTAATPAPTAGSTTPEKGDTEYVAYYNANQNKGKDASFVEFHEDGSFLFVERNGLGATEIRGLWGAEGDMLLFSNFENEIFDAGGNHLYNFEMRMYDEDTLILQRSIESSHMGDIFTTNAQIPEALTEENVSYRHDAIADVNDAYLPLVEFNADGTFVFTENCYAGMGQYKGWYEKTEIGYICHVEDASSMKGFAGEDVGTIYFENYDAALTLLQTNLCMSRKGDKFYIVMDD